MVLHQNWVSVGIINTIIFPVKEVEDILIGNSGPVLCKEQIIHWSLKSRSFPVFNFAC